jgi:hypothetical protein
MRHANETSKGLHEQHAICSPASCKPEPVVDEDNGEPMQVLQECQPARVSLVIGIGGQGRFQMRTLFRLTDMHRKHEPLVN